MQTEVRTQIVEHLILRGATSRTTAVKLTEVTPFLDADPAALLETVMDMQDAGEIVEKASAVFLPDPVLSLAS